MFWVPGSLQIQWLNMKVRSFRIGQNRRLGSAPWRNRIRSRSDSPQNQSHVSLRADRAQRAAAGWAENHLVPCELIRLFHSVWSMGIKRQEEFCFVLFLMHSVGVPLEGNWQGGTDSFLPTLCHTCDGGTEGSWHLMKTREVWGVFVLQRRKIRTYRQQ